MLDIRTFGGNGQDQLSDLAAFKSAVAGGGQFPYARVIYLPQGTYIAEDLINMQGTGSCILEGCPCCVTFQGQGPDYTVIKLRENSPGYDNAASPKTFIESPSGNLSFRYNLYDLKIQIGSGNPGAKALSWNANNMGALDNVVIISDDGNALCGLDMTRQWPGPCLAKTVTVQGFQYGIQTAQGQYGPTFEGITLENQKTAGWKNDGNVLNIHDLRSVNTVPAFVQTAGTTVLVDADLRTPQGQTSARGAIETNGYIYCRSISSSGYATVLKKNGVAESRTGLTEYCSTTNHFSLFGDPWGSLKLEVKKSPEFHDNDTTMWVSVLADSESMTPTSPRYPSLKKALARAAANGLSTVYVPLQSRQSPFPLFNGPVEVPPQVKKIQGFDCLLKPPGTDRTHIDIVGTTTDPLIIENLSFSGVSFHLQSSRPVVFRHCEFDSLLNSPGCGDLFLEDMSPLVFLQYPQRVWVRQYDAERQSCGTDCYKRLRFEAWGCQVWMLGQKTEGAGTLLTARKGSAFELMGGFIYPIGAFTADMAATPAFICDESCMSLIYVMNGGGYNIDVREIRNGVTRDLTRAQVGGSMPLFVANGGCSSVTARPPAELSPRAERFPARALAADLDRGVALPAAARGLALFTVRGELLWRCARTGDGDQVVTIPLQVRSRRVAFVRYLDR